MGDLLIERRDRVAVLTLNRQRSYAAAGGACLR
jgi:hypothetical protein